MQVRACSEVREVEVASKLACDLHGGWAGILVAMEGFTMPVQCVFEPDIVDLFWYLRLTDVSWSLKPRAPCEGYDGHLFSARSSRGRPSLNYECTPEGARVPTWASTSRGTIWEGRDERACFPTKAETPDHKINLWFRDVWSDALTYDRVGAWQFHDSCAGLDFFNDEATAWLLWALATRKELGADAFWLIRNFHRDRPALKKLTTLLKGLGLQSTPLWAGLTELDTLSGRGIAIPEPWDDIRTRVVKSAFLKEKAAPVDRQTLSNALRAVIREELAAAPSWEDPDKYWSSRWAFTKAGAHSGYAESHWRSTRLDLPDRPSRREFAEAQEESVVAAGDPRVDAGISWKLEHGKTRAIYSCDSRSYFTFDYLLKPVEQVWRNSRALLDPGREPQSVFYRRLAAEKGCRFMLDFDDFNSQHSLEAMALCVDIATEGAPEHIRSWARNSWFNMHVHWPGRCGMREELMCGTLPSGHRATSFVNTLLNAAYCRIVAGEDYNLVNSRHTGDDVIFCGPMSACSRIARNFERSVFRANRMKQSIGSRSGEFLRVCFDQHGARGYVARSIASLVSGNWVTESRLSKRSYLENLVRGAWTCCARADHPTFGLFLVSSLKRWVPELNSQAYRLLLHDLSVEGSPVSRGRTADMVDVLRIEGGLARFSRPRARFTSATDAYLHNHMDFDLLEEAEADIGLVRSAMISASYKPRGVKGYTPIKYGTSLATSLVLHDQPSTFHRLSRVGKGETEALALLRSLYSTLDWRFIVAKVRGGTPSAISTEGKMEWPVLSNYVMPFSDCMRARSHLTRPGLFINVYPVRA